MSAVLVFTLGLWAVLLVAAAAGRKLHALHVTRRVTALGVSAGLGVRRSSTIGGRDGAPLTTRPLRRWRRLPAVDWAATLEGVAREVRTGSSLSSAVAGFDERASPRLHRAVQRHAVGVPLAEALAVDLEGVPATDGGAADESFAMAALRVAASVGGNVAATLDRAAGTLRERRAIHDDRAVQSAQARLSARVLSVLPVAFALWCVSTDGRVAHFLLSSSAGWVCLAAGAALNLSGWWWMRRLIRSVGRSS